MYRRHNWRSRNSCHTETAASVFHKARHSYGMILSQNAFALSHKRTYNFCVYICIPLMQRDTLIWKLNSLTVNEESYWTQSYIFSGYSVCWPCMCGVMFCRYTCWSRDHHVRAEYQLPLWSENGTRRLYCSASTILKSLDIYYIHIFYHFPFEKIIIGTLV
jgi:hypothetical protein